MNNTENALQLLPTTESDCEQMDIMIMIVIYCVVTHILSYFWFSCSDIVDWHKQHQYYEEMNAKSDKVCVIMVW